MPTMKTIDYSCTLANAKRIGLLEYVMEQLHTSKVPNHYWNVGIFQEICHYYATT